MDNLPIIDSQKVQALIPQKKPFVMVDMLLDFKENEIEAALTVSDDNLFCNDGLFLESGIVEHMAQTVALYTGYQYHIKNQEAPTGYIGSIKYVEINQLPKLGEQLVTKANVLQEFMGVTLVEIETKVNNEVIAKAQMKTVLAA